MISEELAAKLPEMCFVVLSDGEPGQMVGIVRRGEMGCHLTDYGCQTAEAAKIIVDRQNRRLGVTELQAQCMHAGSLFGWDKPGADPEAMQPFLPAPKEQLLRQRLDGFLQEVMLRGGDVEIYEKVMAELLRRGRLSIGDLRAISPSGDVAAEHLAQAGLVERSVETLTGDGGQVRGSRTWYAAPIRPDVAPAIIMGSRYPLLNPSQWDDEYGVGYGFVEPAHDADQDAKAIRCYVVKADGERHPGFWNETPTVVLKHLADWSQPVRHAAPSAPSQKRSPSMSM